MMLLLPFLFVAVAGLGLYFLWRQGRRRGSGTVTAISSRAGPAVPSAWLGLFFLVFLGIGSVALYVMALQPIAKILEARDWPSTPCTVLSSQVQSHPSSDSTTYSVDIVFAYAFKGDEFRSSQYSFAGGSSSGYRGKAAIVNQHPPGRATVCFVNPNDPREAVLERGFTPAMWFGLFPLIFVAIGVGGLVFVFRGRRTARGQVVPSPLGTLPASASFPDGPPPPGIPPRLKSGRQRWGQFLGLLFVALFWNGIVSVFVIQIILSWRRHQPEWFLTIFMIPFVAVGLVLVGCLVQSFLRLWNPMVNLTLNSTALALGDKLEVSWDITGRVSVIAKLRLYLEGREESTYQRGTRSHTDKSVFTTLDLAVVASRHEMSSGRATVNLPSDTVPSFASKHNKIVWTLVVQGEIERWPDIKDEHVLTILPRPLRHPAPL